MTLQEKLELAARVMPGVGKVHNANTGEEFMAILDSDPHHHCINGEGRWDPSTDDGDSRRLEIACLNWIREYKRQFSADLSTTFHAYLWMRDSSASYGKKVTPEQYRAAVLDLAAAIGEVINAV